MIICGVGVSNIMGWGFQSLSIGAAQTRPASVESPPPEPRKHHGMGWITVTDRAGRSRRVRGDMVQSIESITIAAGDYFGPEVATCSILHFANRTKLRVVERSEQIEAMIEAM